MAGVRITVGQKEMGTPWVVKGMLGQALHGDGNDAPGGKWSGWGTIYLSSMRMVFVPTSSSFPTITAFDMPLAYIHDERFNQPIFGCNNLSGKVFPVVDDSRRPLYSVHNFKVLFKEGGVGTFIPMFFRVLCSVRPPPVGRRGSELNSNGSSTPTSQPPVEQMIRSAYIDPNDPTKLYLQQPTWRSARQDRMYAVPN
ncbi:hypothetical protein CBR_g24147 [Chara braunii]|uniref:Uncharacterized protein n=1 Tax=Chara braunii TaxID=69332 RepID=A0A388L5W4_CHABU|nr:hypothetical protein CBR_g24147 [Chara braunii]|eukprot:GBG77701.1 hypothetical protein CBR_g24147 [Chara braunii]